VVILAAFVSLIVALLLTRAFTRPGSSMHILDHPNERSLHTRPTPRTGGVAIVAGILSGGIVLTIPFGIGLAPKLLWLGGLAAVIAFVSYLDDRRQLHVWYRLSAHVAVSVLLPVAGLSIGPLSLPGFTYELSSLSATVVTVLFTVWMINLYNFMDGMDGFAGGMTAIGFGVLAVLGWLNDDHLFAGANMIIAASAVGFLAYNFPPAKIFMGDTGSSTLGLLAAGMSLWGDSSGSVPLWISMLVFSPFIVDATVTLARRFVRREKVWQAHKTHYYQRLVQVGWGHRKTVLLEYGLMVACAGAGLVAAQTIAVATQWSIIAAVALLYLGFFWFVHLAEVRGGRSVTGVTPGP